MTVEHHFLGENSGETDDPMARDNDFMWEDDLDHEASEKDLWGD